MKTNSLGLNGPNVSKICFGAWPIAGGMGAIDSSQAIKTIHAAIDGGINFIDTAEGYENSESILGKALIGKRENLILATKLSGNDHSEKHIRTAIDNSLQALKTDYIDLYQLHRPQSKWPISDTIANLLKLKEEGKIRYIGISNHSISQTKEAMKYGPIQSSQPRYNMIFQEDESANLKFCKENQIGVMPHSVLAKGLLTAKYSANHSFPNDDERKSFSFFKGELFNTINTLVLKLDAWAKDNHKDIVQLSIAWVLSNPAVSSAIVGMKTTSQVNTALKSLEWNLSKSDLLEITNLIGSTNFKWNEEWTTSLI